MYPVIDLHTDSLIAARLFGYDLGKRHLPPLGFMPWMLHTDFPRLKEGGINGVWLGIVTIPYPPDTCFRRAIERIEFAHEVIRRCASQVELALTPEEMLAAMDKGKIAVMLSVEGLHMAEEDLANLEAFYLRGVRCVGMAHFTSNAFASTNFHAKAETGLSALGKAAVRWMNRMGIVIDLAHTHTRCVREVCEITEAPVIISHTGLSGIRPAQRNASDDDIRLVADTGGVVGVIYATTWISEKVFPTLQEVVDHIDYLRDKVGIDHVALGSDWDGLIMLPRGMRDARDLPRLFHLLEERGYSQKEISKIAGGNFLRTWRRVTEVANIGS